jgi:hypothetical protein
MRIKLSLLLLLAFALPSLAASGVKGTLVDAATGKPVADANVFLRNQSLYVMGGADGVFSITKAAPGSDVLEISAYGYKDLDMDVNIPDGRVIDLGTIRLSADNSVYAGTGNDDYTHDDANALEDEGAMQSIGTIQGATDNIYYQATNYDFSVMRFRYRGYDSNWNAGYINGFNFNDGMRGRFNFSGLGGMTSSAFRNRSVDVGLDASNYGFGNIGGSSNFTTYASEYAPGFRGNFSYTNSNYMLRLMMQYSTGLNKHGWAFSASIIGRYAPEGVIKGTFYNSLGYSLSLQKVFNDKHSINLTTWGAPTQRATNTAATQEAYDLAGTNLYNPSWGYLDGKKKSSKIVESFDPAALVNWIWKPRMGTTVNTGVGFRHSAYSSSALNWYQSADPRPDYYRYLPSYYNPANPWSGNYLEDGENDPLWDTYEANYQYYRHLWQSDESMRQIDWDAIYRTNLLNRTNYDRNPELVGQSSYILENRHSNFSSWMFNSYVDHRINDFMTLQGGVSFNYTDGHYFKTVRNLLGGEFWRDIDNFSERDFPGNPEILQNNLNDPNRRVKEGDKFGYDYHIRTITAKAWLQNQISTRHWNVNYGLEVSYTNFMRHGEMRNGRAPENSYGPGKRHTFDNAAFKAGATYKINGRNYIVAHASYGTRAPMPDQAYVSPRVKDTAIQGLKSERFLSADIAYVWNYNRFRGSVGGFITEMWNGIKRTGFYDYQLNTFMNYSMSGMHTQYRGIELGMSYKILPSLTASAAATIASYKYKNDPLGVRSYENGSQEDVTRRVYLKNYHIGGTPQQAYNVSLNYAAPKNWFFELSANWMGDAYVDLAPSRHEEMPDLYTVVKPAPGQSYEEAIKEKISEITTQEKLKDAFVLNLSIGKLIYTKWGSLNFNLSVNNLLNNRNIQTGGYQEGKFDYTTYDVSKFPNKYYYAQGIRVFFNFGIRF